MHLPAAVRVEEVEGGDGARVASPVLEASLHVCIAVQLSHSHSPSSAESDADVQDEADLRQVPCLQVHQDVLASVVATQGGHCRVATTADAHVVRGASPS